MTHEVVEGTPFALDLSIGSEPFPYPREFRWTRNGVLIGNSSAAYLGYPGIVLHNVSRLDGGIYSLSAFNYRLDEPSIEIGRATGTFELDVLCKSHENVPIHRCSSIPCNVNFMSREIMVSKLVIVIIILIQLINGLIIAAVTDGPDIIRGPSDIVKVQGDDAVLVCGRELSSNPPAMVVWSDNNGNSVDPRSTRILLTSSQGFVSLSVTSIAEGDSGEWTCIIQVENVRTVQYSITLTVLGKIQ